MNTNKIEAGSTFPSITVKGLDGNAEDIGNIKGRSSWKATSIS